MNNVLLSLDLGNIVTLESQVKILLEENNGLPLEARKLYESTIKTWRDTFLANSAEKKVGNFPI